MQYELRICSLSRTCFQLANSVMDFSKLHFSETDKLTGPDNYLIWSHQVMRIFKRYKLWHLIQPGPVTATAIPSQVETAESEPSTSTSRPQPQRVQSTHTVSDKDDKEKCHNILTFTVHRTLIATLKGFGDNPRLVWERLQGRFQSAAEQRKCDLREQLNSLRMTEGTTVQKYLLDFDQIIQQLACVDELIPEKQMSTLLSRAFLLPGNLSKQHGEQ